MTELNVEEIRAEVEAWLDANWSEDLSVGEWWDILGPSGYAHPILAENAYGKGWGRSQAGAVMATMADRNAMGPAAGLGRMLAAPTIAAHGTQAQIDEFIPPILDGRVGWCQLFSEPGAGSDLAGLTTKAERDGDEWVITGQKVWTSGGQIADMGMLIARTNPEAPKHRGITWFAIDMDQPGIDVRPLVEMTGAAMFNEVFLDEARVPHANMIGEEGQGWAVANTTLMFERASLGSAGKSPASASGSGKRSVRSRPVTEFTQRAGGEQGLPPIGMRMWEKLVDVARKRGMESDPVLRQELVKIWSMLEVNRMSQVRAKDPKQRTGAEPNIGKLIMSDLFRGFRELGNAVIQTDGMLTGADEPNTSGLIAETTMFSPAPSIYGGTDQIQRNIIGERILGLPREPGPGKDTPFKDLPKN
ncbi:MAG: acyl-CoA dehydrogenase [Acidimicrobiaceae bacterium]|jgi:alkylation response protein AidB-like acyl-CoA dehydrogenase|nr:acyl-CoA dehydrogenase [Acidimicrobiaceae bacterium]MBT5581355.1 acyl-CoA dehydrogenase [Acidimicrobiaceae bacterium]